MKEPFNYDKQETFKTEENVKELWKGKGNINENKLILKQLTTIILAIIIYLQYFKLIGFLENRYFFDFSLVSITLLIIGMPLCYFGSKYVLDQIKKYL